MLQYLEAWFGAHFDLHLGSEEEGQGLVEYALILVLISVAAIAIMTTVGGNVKDVFTKISGALKVS
jgi:pilus assembly protein Flp/PilA